MLEGLTQAITEDIQREQGIRPLPDRWQANKVSSLKKVNLLNEYSPNLYGYSILKHEY